MRTKEKFPDETTLKAHIVQHIGEYLEVLRKALGPAEEAYMQARKRRKMAVWCVVGMYISLSFLFGTNLLKTQTVQSYITAFVLSAVIVLSLVFAFRFYRGTSQHVRYFNQKYNATIFELIFKILEADGTHVLHTQKNDDILKRLPTNDFQSLIREGWKVQKFSNEYAEINETLKMSELITEEYNATHVDDMFNFMIGLKKMFVAELGVMHIIHSRKRSRVKNIFTGYFVTLEIDKNLTGKTFVSTEGDTEGFGHQNFWNNLTNNGPTVTQLEWSDFENLLHVATTDPVEARYVLPPDFMSDLYNWWRDKKQNIRISFIQNHMYMLFPSTHVRFGKTVPSLTEEEVLKYIESLSIPLLHILHLADDASRQFNK